MNDGPITRHPARWGGREGFALPAAIFAILVVAILVTAGFLFSSQEFRIGQSSDRTVQARMIAEEGLNTVMAGAFDAAQMEQFASLGIWDGPGTFTGQMGDGEWTVVVRRVADRTYRLESTGLVTQGGRLAGARRTLGAMVRNVANTDEVDFTQLDDDAALATRGPVETRGNAQIIGYDEPVADWGGFGGEVCPGDPEDRPGVINTLGDDVDSRGSSLIAGNPPYTQIPDPGADEFMRFGENGEIGWAELVAAATHSLPGGTFPSVGPTYNQSGICDTGNPLNWGEPHVDTDAMLDGNPYSYPTTHCWHYFPVIHIDGNAQMGGGGSGGGRGQGILLIDGNLNINGGFEFYGMILVRGQIETQGNGNRVIGSIRAQGSAELESSDYAGGSILRYSSCAVSRSQNNAFQPPTEVFLVPVGSRSWMDLTAAGY